MTHLTAVAPVAEHAFVTQRLWELHKHPEQLDAYLALLQRQRLACDEVWFSTDYGFPPLAVHREAAARMAAAAERVRALGIVASLQISNTLGHGDYLRYLDFGGIAWQRMVGPDGTVAPYSNCPRDPDFHAYLDASTRAYCAWEPDSVWIDDDLRMHHHSPIDYGCFCDLCLAGFNAETGGEWTRVELVAAINAGNDLETRAAWLAWGRESLSTVAGVIARAVKAVAPGCWLGLQHSDHAWGGYSGPDWTPIFETLARISELPVGSRPGGGFYTDHAPREMVTKAIYGGLQNSRLPACVDHEPAHHRIRVEVENLPGAVTGKSARGTALEATLALAYGSTGLTFTPLMFTHEEIAWHERVLAEIARWRPFWLRYLDAASGVASRPGGLAIVLGRRFAQRRLGPDEPAFAWAATNLGALPQLATLGLSLTWDWSASEAGGVGGAWATAEAAPPGFLLHPNAVDGLEDDEIRALLGCGVVTDGEAVHRLEARGFGALLGLATAPANRLDANERLLEDDLNGPYAGRTVGLTGLSRSFPAYGLHGAEHTEGISLRVLAHYVRTDSTLSAPATVAVTTPFGGRWVVFGNGCWSSVATTAQRAQLLAAADWVSSGRLPALLDTPGQVVVVPRVDAENRVCSVLLLNCSLDATAPELALRLRRPRSHRAHWLRPSGDITAMALAGEDAQIALPGLQPWGVGAVLLDGS
jgi:hypothetical protein